MSKARIRIKCDACDYEWHANGDITIEDIVLYSEITSGTISVPRCCRCSETAPLMQPTRCRALDGGIPRKKRK